MTTVCGFIVLRRPDQNFDATCVAPFYLPSTSPCINEICYSGLVRAPWYELEEGVFNETLPDHLVKLRDELYEENQPYLDIKLFKNFGKANEILEYSNSVQDRYELSAIYSEKLADMKGDFDASINIDWLGCDIFYYGYGSQLLNGIFSKPQEFSEMASLLNSNGLIDNKIDEIEAYITAYNQISSSLNLEPIADLDPSLKDIIKIGKVV